MDRIESVEEYIDLMEIFLVLRRYINRIILSGVTLGLIAAVVTIFIIPKKYTATTRIFAVPNVTSTSTDYTSINANDKMVNNYMEMLKGTSICDSVDASLGLTEGTTIEAIKVSNQTDTQIITLSATTKDPALSKKIVDRTVAVFYSELRTKLDITNVTTIDTAITPKEPSSPSLKRNVALGLIAGVLVACLVIIIRHLMDTRINDKEQAEKFFDLPVFGVVPETHF